jgi:hypothetical protein
MFKSIKRIKDKLYFLYIDKVVNNPATLNEYEKLGGLDIDDGHVATLILEDDLTLPQEVIEDATVPAIVEVETSSEEIAPAVVEQPKKKAGRPKSTTKTTTKSTTKKVPSKKLDPSS